MASRCISPLSVTLMMMMTRDVSVMSRTFVAGEDKTIVQSRRQSHCHSHHCHCQHTKKATHWPCSICCMWCTIVHLHHLPPFLDDCDPWKILIKERHFSTNTKLTWRNLSRPPQTNIASARDQSVTTSSRIDISSNTNAMLPGNSISIVKLVLICLQFRVKI